MEQLKHECGIVMVRLLKPLTYFQEKYGDWGYGLRRLYLMMEKQRNRGQEGAGLGVVKLAADCGAEYIYRERADGQNAINKIFKRISTEEKKHSKAKLMDCDWAYKNLPYAGDIYMGHMRYSTTGRSDATFIHPFLRRSNRRSQSLMICGNFNLTNTDEIFDHLVAEGQHPRIYADTYMMLEMLGSRLDDAVADYRNGHTDKLDIGTMIKKTATLMDGGYIICGVIGTGDMFCFRDPAGIRSAFYFKDDEIMVAASERAVIQTVMNVEAKDVHELPPAHSLIVRADGETELIRIHEDRPLAPCSFERIYFSRGSDGDIYKERKMLGRLLVEPILNTIDHNIDKSVFSFIPNTAEAAYFGMLEGLEDYLTEQKKQMIREPGADFDKILSMRIRHEKVAVKDVKLRTFIANNSESGRDDMAAHVYDVTYGSINSGDNLVVIDDSIVRGTTLKQSIIKILDRLHPKKIVIVSSSPQIRYPDCYGIDMHTMDEFIAFHAAIDLLKERGQEALIHEVYELSVAQLELPKQAVVNHVKKIYEPFTNEEISARIAKLLTPADTKAEVEIVYQDIAGLHKACPEHSGDWYFSGDYPTAGGNAVVNKAFVVYHEKVYGK